MRPTASQKTVVPVTHSPPLGSQGGPSKSTPKSVLWGKYGILWAYLKTQVHIITHNFEGGTMTQQRMPEPTVPNPGRMYDYYLGGYHNFEVDRRAAEQVIKLMPFTPKMTRLQRWCLQDIARELTYKRGFDTIIDFGSGLPTQDHIHLVVPEGTTVIYSDLDPITVEYAHEILDGTSNTYYVHADARQPHTLLNHTQVREIIGPKRDVALVYWGIGVFHTDQEIAQIVRTLYDWSGDQACLVFNAHIADLNLKNPVVIKMLEIYKQTGVKVYMRSLAEYQALIHPWKVDGAFLSLLEWHGFDLTEMNTEDLEAFSPAGGGYGAYLIK